MIEYDMINMFIFKTIKRNILEMSENYRKILKFFKKYTLLYNYVLLDRS